MFVDYSGNIKCNLRCYRKCNMFTVIEDIEGCERGERESYYLVVGSVHYFYFLS